MTDRSQPRPIDPPSSERAQQAEQSPIPLSNAILETIRAWASNDRMWGSRESTETNLCTFARIVLKDAALRSAIPQTEQDHNAELAAAQPIPDVAGCLPASNRLAAVEAANVTLNTENAQLRQALRVIRKGLSEDADGEFWPARRWLDQRNIFPIVAITNPSDVELDVSN